MRRIKDIREDYNLVTEKEQTDISKLTALVRAGLFDAKKIGIVKRALEKNPAEMTLAERKILIELLESLMSEVLHSQQVYSKVKQNVMGGKEKMNEAAKDSYLTKFDPRMTKYPSESDIPAVLILKRKAIRVYPDNQKVALYYAQAIDKYVSIPYGNINTAINETNFYDVPITTYTPEDQKRADSIIDKKSGRSPFFKAGLKLGMRARRKFGPTLGKAADATKEYVGKKVKQITKKPKTGLGNLKKGFQADRSDKPYLSNPRDYDNKIISPSASTMHKIGKGVSSFGTKTGLYETFAEKVYQKRMANEDVSDFARGALNSFSAKVAPGDREDIRDTAFASAARKARDPKVKEKILNTQKQIKDKDVSGKVDADFEKEQEKQDAARETSSGQAGETVGNAAQLAAGAYGLVKGAARLFRGKPKPTDNKGGKGEKGKGDGKKGKGDGKKAAGVAGAASALGAALLGGSGGEKTFTKPGEFKLGAKISDPTEKKVDTNVAADTKARNQYNKSLSLPEGVISQLYTIKENYSEGYININNDNIAINKNIAEKVINVFESLNEENQKKVNAMLNESVDSFKKIINFAVRQ